MRSVPQLSAIVLDSASAVESVNRACAELYELFSAAGTSAVDAWRSMTDRRLDSGLALSPALAAKCMLDGRRTQAFARGALTAITRAVRDRAAGVVEVVYAGTGPFAPLAFLIMPFIDSKRVRFTLLDVNAESTQSVSALVDALRLADHVRDIVCSDATTYRHPTRIDVVISETMQRSLAEEPFVAILRNLRPQLASGGVIVPERVTIGLTLLDPASEQSRWNGSSRATDTPALVGKVFEIDASGEWPAKGTARTISVTYDRGWDTKWLALVMRIVVNRDEVLEPYVSGLTIPEILWGLSPVTRDLTLEFRYLDGRAPRIEWRERHMTASSA